VPEALPYLYRSIYFAIAFEPASVGWDNRHVMINHLPSCYYHYTLSSVMHLSLQRVYG